jgi:hypothetical protein
VVEADEAYIGGKARKRHTARPQRNIPCSRSLSAKAKPAHGMLPT